MTVTRVPARNPEPEGLDGRGTTHAADLPARTANGVTTWDTPWPQRVFEDVDMDVTPTVLHRLCLAVDPRGGDWPGRCGDERDHEGLCDWARPVSGSLLTERRREEIREGDTPSGVLPRRTPGEALGDVESESEPGVRPGCERGSDRVLERWEA